MSRIAIIGAGAWGTALSIVLARKGTHEVRLWAHEPEVCESISQRRVNERFLPGHEVPADRMVSQVSTEHPEKNGHFPHVTFLGTQFDNLKVSGIPLKIKLNYGVCGPKLSGDRSYLDNVDFLNEVKDRTEEIAKSGILSKEAQLEYDKRLISIKHLIANGGSQCSGRPKEGIEGHSVICSLVSKIDKSIEEAIEGVKVYGHLLFIPDFGTVSLGEVTVGERWEDPHAALPGNYFELTVIKMNLGCVGHGTVSGGTAANNGLHCGNSYTCK